MQVFLGKAFEKNTRVKEFMFLFVYYLNCDRNTKEKMTLNIK